MLSFLRLGRHRYRSVSPVVDTFLFFASESAKVACDGHFFLLSISQKADDLHQHASSGKNDENLKKTIFLLLG